MNKHTLRQILVIVALLATIVVNGLANALPINGLQTGEISDSFVVYFTPAGYVFSIWGLIYLALLVYAVYQALPAQKENPKLVSIGYLFVWSNVANIAWIFLWQYLVFPLTIFVMLALLACLIAIYLRLGVGGAKAAGADKWLVQIPFSIYLGWITVATIANATALLDYLNWDGWGISPEAWTVIMLTVAVIVSGLMAFTRRSIAYGLVLMWAFAGIAVKHSATPLVSNSAWAAVALVALFLIAGDLWDRRQMV
jgi:hypothetical protein